MMKRLWILLFAILVASPALGQDSGSETDPLLVQASIWPQTWESGQVGELRLELTLPEKYKAYEEQFKLVVLEPAGFKVGQIKVTPVIEWFDKFSKRQRRGIERSATLTAVVEAPAQLSTPAKKIKLELMYQACSDTFCLFPTPKDIEVPIRTILPENTIVASPSNAKNEVSLSDFFSAEQFGKLLSRGLGPALLFVFIAGLLTSFTPCIFPMIPITLAVLGQDSEKRSRLSNFILSVFYVLGIAVTYSSLGVIAASTGGLFGATLGNPWVLGTVCGIFLLMALSMYGLFEIQVPAFLRNRFGRSTGGKQGLFGAFVTGLFAGIVASPCVGPVLVGILTYVSAQGNLFTGFILLFTYALGLGLIFLLLGLSNQFTRYLPKSGPWMNFSKFILGSLMLSAFFYYLDLLIPTRWWYLTLGISMVTVASVFGAFINPRPAHTTGKKLILIRLRKISMITVLVVGLGYILQSVFNLPTNVQVGPVGDLRPPTEQRLPFVNYSDELLQKALTDKKPVIIDFWADWCAACHELEQKTFVDAQVHLALKDFVLLKFDATKESPELQELRKQYGIKGLPTLVFYDPQGQWRQELTLTEFENVERFLKRIEKVQTPR